MPACPRGNAAWQRESSAGSGAGWANVRAALAHSRAGAAGKLTLGQKLEIVMHHESQHGSYTTQAQLAALYGKSRCGSGQRVCGTAGSAGGCAGFARPLAQKKPCRTRIALCPCARVDMPGSAHGWADP